MVVYLASWVIPVSSPALRDGAVAIAEGRVAAVGPRDRVLADLEQGAEVRELGNVALLPGLINAHCHTELSWLAEERPAGGDYLAWLADLLDRRAHEEPEPARNAAERALQTMRARGTVGIGDVSNAPWIAPLLAASGLQGILFFEILGFRGDAAETKLEEAAQAMTRMAADAEVRKARRRLRIVLTPHAPHTTSPPLLRALAGRAAAAGDPLSIHVAESLPEVELLADGGGPLRRFFIDRGFWDETWTPPGHSPVEYLQRSRLLTARTLAVHCVHLNHQDHSRLQVSRATVVTCPRSNRYLGVGRTPVTKLLAEGVPVALGTDSLASAPDLDLFAEMAALREEHPSLACATVVRMATWNGAQALGLAERLGTIDEGKLAELAAVALPEGCDRPLEWICSLPSRVDRLEDAPWEPAS